MLYIWLLDLRGFRAHDMIKTYWTQPHYTLLVLTYICLKTEMRLIVCDRVFREKNR